VLAGGPAAELVLRAQALPLEGGRSQHLQVIQNGLTVASRSVKPGFLELQMPLPASRSDRQIELRWAGTTQIGPNDRR
jgi:hypothetical protein